MTSTQTPATSISVAPGSRLEDLLAVYDDVKATADEANTRLDAVKTAIKAELAALAPDAKKIDVSHSALAQPLRLAWVTRWDLDSKRLKAEDPATYVKYAKQGGRWELRGLSA